ncbi:fused signal recognition particle receptor [Methylomarinovum tepidoasis]|uniref:Signal recognition particle receptor FtsY n=1 Tax=Methylomarinovum tepidoasis TaxID=2840183 RepID=A0AAU9BZX8_9GAMM|nr:signal recognition particle-docking protein FtsY [Methylomarinovum sp. IN45]BCX89330.1 fused signal recognition particle receptor [Methylomarinovum sp. IN45]
MYRKFVLLTLFFLVVTFALGVYVRATGAGTACPDAPACFGQWWPPEDLPPETLQRYPGIFYDAAAARLHMLHRLAAGAAGVLLLGLLVTAVRHPRRRTALIGSWSLALLYGLQAGLGAALVASRMMPALVAFHWLTGTVMILVAFGWYLRLAPVSWERYTHTHGLRRLALTALGVALLQGWLGALVGANYADLVCPDFPTCQGRWWPESLDWHALAFWEQWRYGLSGWSLPDADGRITLHWLHRLGALVGFVVLFLLGLSISSNPKAPHLSKVGVLLNFLLLVVIAFGMSVVIKGAPAYLVVGHSLAALAILVTGYGVAFFLRYGPPLPRARAAEAIGEAPPPEVPVPPPVEVPPAPETLFERLKSGLGKTRKGLTGFLASLPLAGRELDEELLEEIETHLLMADVGVEATEAIIDRLKACLSRQQLKDQETVMQALHDVLLEILEPCSRPLRIDPAHKPFVILVVGVNGVGKTTTIGKLAKRLQRQGHSVMLAAGDTFRAAAVEQLKVWGERNQVPVVAQHTGADSASVIYDALQAAKARGIDVLIADTAGRLHTKSNLMEELAKIKRIMAKLDPTAPHEVLLVLDATTGQNAISQAEQFNQAVGVTGIALTKLDGTAKGGVIFALAKRFGIPIRFIGIGEGIDDLQDFDARAFVDALFAEQPREAPAPVLH